MFAICDIRVIVATVSTIAKAAADAIAVTVEVTAEPKIKEPVGAAIAAAPVFRIACPQQVHFTPKIPL